jgi:tetratricopeptide (TPR) repeat protein
MWAEALAAFDEVVSLDSGARRARLGAIGATDPALRQAVEQLLAADSLAHISLEKVDAVLGAVAPDADPLRLAGRTVMHFRIIEPIARGGMGVVYRAEDTRLGRPVALKVPLTARYADPAALGRFRQEARAAAALDHPNLCPVFETGETADGDLFYTMPLYDGETLKARLARDGALPLADAVDVAVQLARGIGAAHHAGIVHRDLKPGNVMLLPDGSVKVLDFGLAKASDLTLTGSWAMLGTVAYMAPEQLQGHKVDPRADLWALGVVMYEMVTGARPFGGGHEIGIAHAILHQATTRASERREEIPSELDDVIDTCLQKDPAQRWPSAEALATALAGLPLDVRPRRLHRLRRALTGRRRRWRTPAIAAAGATALALVAARAGVARRAASAAVRPVSLAVVPFDRQGDSARVEPLAIGLSDAIGTELGQLRGVTAPGAVTMSIYRGTPKTPAEIGGELHVGELLRGRVQQVGERVRVAAQLLDAGGTRRWLRQYERPQSELREIQRAIVRDVVASLAIRPSPEQVDALSHPAAIDGLAYETYLQGRAVELAGRSPDPIHQVPAASIRQAMSLYSRARDIDPGFALARARLALMHTLAATAYDTSESRREQARVEAQIALRLSPALPEGHEALATYALLRNDPTTAVAEFERALEAAPNSAPLRLALGGTLSRFGRFDDALVQLRRAMELDARNAEAAFLTAQAYSWLRRRAEAMPIFDRAIALAPESPVIKVIKGQAYLRWKGTADTLAALLEQVPPGWDPCGLVTFSRYTAYSVQRRYADGIAMLERAPTMLCHDFFVYQPNSLMRARLYDGMGDRARARSSYAAARRLLQDSLRVHPDDPHIRVSLGYAEAGLGRRAEAVREGRRALELAPIAKGSEVAQVVMGGAVEVFAKAGQHDAALDLLELLFSMSAGRDASVPLLRVWPGYDPLRGDPRFEQLLVRFAAAQ